MPRLVAKQKFTYATRVLQPGDAFEASDEDARLLCGFDKAEPARSISAETSEPEERKTGRYRRRDMRAER